MKNIPLAIAAALTIISCAKEKCYECTVVITDQSTFGPLRTYEQDPFTFCGDKEEVKGTETLLSPIEPTRETNKITTCR